VKDAGFYDQGASVRGVSQSRATSIRQHVPQPSPPPVSRVLLVLPEEVGVRQSLLGG
jgi:hypothetical protein